MTPEDHEQYVKSSNKPVEVRYSHDERDDGDDETKIQVVKFYYILLAIYKIDEIKGLTQLILSGWSELRLLLTLFETEKTACDYYYNSGINFPRIEKMCLFSVPTINDKRLYEERIDIKTVRSYIDLSGYQSPNKSKKKKNKSYEHNDPIFIKLVELLNQKNPSEIADALLLLRKKCDNEGRRQWLYEKAWFVLENDYAAFKILFENQNRIINALSFQQLLILWEKYRENIIKDIYIKYGEIGQRKLALIVDRYFFIKTGRFAIEVDFTDLEGKFKNDEILQACVELEKKIISKRVRHSNKLYKNITMSTEGILKLLKTKSWRKALKKGIIRDAPAKVIETKLSY